MEPTANPQKLVLLGETKDEFGGSIWQQISGAGLNGLPPQVDLGNEAKLGEFFAAAAGQGLIAASHDLSEGGLGVAAFEMAKSHGVGVDLDLSVVHADAFTALFSESASRVLVAVDTEKEAAVLSQAAALGISAVTVGETNDSGNFSFNGQSVAITDLRTAWSATLPNLFGHAVGANSVVE